MASSQTLGEGLIPIINKLQDIFSQVTLDFKLDLPQIAVVGSQSSGKSSVLEALVGRDFLPRGPDICTRRPLVLQLVKTTENSGEDGAEWGEFLHAKGKKFYDFERIRDEIAAETDRVVGENKAVSDKPIRLKICSPDVLTMTLVDLPGITRVPVGDQPSDIETRIRDMILEYVRHPTCIILGVTAANVDLANSDALSMARSVDPEGVRTIGVLTKLDIMDRGTNAVAVLKNQVVPLRLGYVAIVNRSQDDINKKKAMSAARRNEEDFFRSHLEYREAASQTGVPNLAQRLNSILVAHIQSMLPGLRRQITHEIEKRNAELRDYGDAPPTDSATARGAVLLGLLSEYCQRFASMLDGRSENVLVGLAGGAKIRDIFQNQFVRQLGEMEWRSDLTTDLIRTTIRNSSGVSGSLLIPQEPFELLVRRSIKRLLEPALRCKDAVQNELLRLAADCSPQELCRFSALQRGLSIAVGDYIRGGGEPADQMIRSLIDCEHDYINYDHPDFIGGKSAVAAVLADKKMRAGKRAEAAKQQVDGTAEQPARNQRNNTENRPQPTVRNARGPRTETIGSTAMVGLKGIQDTGGSLSQASRTESAGRTEYDGDGAPGGGWFSSLFAGRPEAPQLPPADPPSSSSSPNPLPTENSDTYRQIDIAVDITRKLVDNYMNLVQSNISDLVPKIIMHFLVHRSQRGLQQHLIGKLYKEELFDELVSEREDVMKKRQNCQTALRALNEALHTLDAMPQELAEQQFPSFCWQSSGFGDPIDNLKTSTGGHRRFTAGDRHPSMARAAHATQKALQHTALRSSDGKSNPFEFPS
ncbi:unnamed protein product [Ostreobium quekettii]|uniref:Uncharacterized protein n=1 Tax=Ostreobium quekettii TaxID=121088 RepID=A0A8S1JHY4_9CHLO|nr:unnamed protein product [Ostreobium quekettii]|eukprot:evm.model.scf_381.3 EVM.evm.TU.scf_381.3   scf_381:45173-49735(-)